MGKKNAFGLAGLCLITTLIVLETNVVNLALPILRAHFAMNNESEIWIMDAYTLLFSSLLISAGSVGTKIGVRKACYLGLIVFGISSLGCASSFTVTEFILFRVLQGVGAALIAPAPLTLIASMYDDLGACSQAVALWGSISGLGFLIGPVLSGVMLDVLGWRSIFLINIPIVFIVYGILWFYVDEVPAREVSFDLIGQILIILALSSGVVAIIHSSISGWNNPYVIVFLFVAFLSFIGFFTYEKICSTHGISTLLPMAIFSARPVVGGVMGGFLFSFTLYGLTLIFSLYFQEIYHYSSLISGLAFLPLTLTAVITSTWFTGRFIEKFGPKTGLATGMSLCAVSFIILILMPQPIPYLYIAISFVLFGIGMVISGPSQIVTIMTYVSEDYRNMGSSVLNTARQCGGLLGTAILGAIVSPQLIARTSLAMFVGFIASLIGVIIAVLFIPRYQYFTAYEKSAQ